MDCKVADGALGGNALLCATVTTKAQMDQCMYNVQVAHTDMNSHWLPRGIVGMPTARSIT